MRATLWLVRLAFTVMALMAVAQPILIGSYLSGQFDALRPHSLSGSLLPLASMVGGLVSLLYWLVGRGRVWPLLATVVLFVLVGVQVGAGHSRNVALHVPLGVALVGLMVALAVWSWTPAAKWQRPAKKAGAVR